MSDSQAEEPISERIKRVMAAPIDYRPHGKPTPAMREALKSIRFSRAALDLALTPHGAGAWSKIQLASQSNIKAWSAASGELIIFNEAHSENPQRARSLEESFVAVIAATSAYQMAFSALSNREIAANAGRQIEALAGVCDPDLPFNAAEAAERLLATGERKRPRFRSDDLKPIWDSLFEVFHQVSIHSFQAVATGVSGLSKRGEYEAANDDQAEA